jgi:radical SAM protein with 4Fe4S-binding SPASM domain
MFISHTGEIYPSGFLPISAGHVRRDRLADIYRYAPLFRELRRPASFEGVCGVCDFNTICGGSRSRALALTGSHLASDPWCLYEPARAHGGASVTPGL